MPQVRLKEEVQRFEKRVRDQVAPGSVDNLSALLVQNFNVMNSYYSENLAQSRTSAVQASPLPFSVSSRF